MIIELKKFGQILTSRDDGHEAYLSLQNNIIKKEKIVISFDNTRVLTPGWADEFLTPLFKKFNDKLLLKKTDNPSVKATIETLEEVNKIKFKRRNSKKK
jgi:hypothetical protein